MIRRDLNEFVFVSPGNSPLVGVVSLVDRLRAVFRHVDKTVLLPVLRQQHLQPLRVHNTVRDIQRPPDERHSLLQETVPAARQTRPRTHRGPGARQPPSQQQQSPLELK